MQNWARWTLTQGSGVLGYAAVNLADADAGRDGYIEAPVPVSDVEARETDDAVARLPGELKATVIELYLGKGGIKDKLARLYCAEGTLHRRIGQAHRLLADHFLVQQDKRRAERDRVEGLQAAMRPK